MGLPANMISLLRQLMSYWKTRLEIWNEGLKKVSRWNDVMCDFLQGDSYSPVGFCLSEVPVCKLLQETKSYRMGQPGKKEVKWTPSLFIDDLKVYQEIHKILKDFIMRLLSKQVMILEHVMVWQNVQNYLRKRKG